MKTWTNAVSYKTYDERLDYLRLGGILGAKNEAVNRYFAEHFYRDPVWKRARRLATIRDSFCDLAIPGLDLLGVIVVHHINPLTMNDVVTGSPKLFDLENLITTSLITHNAIHYGSKDSFVIIERKENDTILW